MFDAPLGVLPKATARPNSPGGGAPAAGTGGVAVIGSGIAGLSAAWLLSRRYRVTLFEAAPQLGGHSRTIEVEAGGRMIPVDTGFIVFNERTYPNLTRLFRHLGVATERSDMSFAVSIAHGRIEYAGAKRLAGLFAQKSNLLRPRFWRLLADTLRFYREFRHHDARSLAGLTLGDLLAGRGYGQAFRDDHLLPMAAAIWSGTFQSILDFPAACFLAFCRNHGLLQVSRRPKWRTVSGRSCDYVRRLAAGISGPIEVNTPVAAIRRDAQGVEIVLRDGRRARFHHCVVAAHADSALRMLVDASPEERRLLGAFAFHPNHGILHRDAALMPKRRACWASWNYIADGASQSGSPVFITYWLNRLQNLVPAAPLFLSLNASRRPRDETVIAEFDYDHPQFDAAAIAAQVDLHRIQGVRNTWFSGAWTGYGFHEDGLRSGMAVASALGVEVPWSAPAGAPADHPAPVLVPARVPA